jgi:hypothetical protein
MSYVPPGKVAADWRPDNEHAACKYRFRLGAAGPIATGAAVNAENVPMVANIGETAGTFVRCDLVVGHATTASDEAPPTASGVSPVGSDLVIDVQKSTDSGNTWASVFSTADQMPRLAAGQVSQSTFLNRSDVSVQFSNQIRVVVESVGSTTPGTNILCSLLGFMEDD